MKARRAWKKSPNISASKHQLRTKSFEALQSKGYLYFGRDSISGFFIRLIERAGSAETVIEIPITGKVNRYGELIDFPELLGHFPTLLVGAEPGNVFALVVIEDIPEVSMLAQDLLICDVGKLPQPGDIAILPFGKESGRYFLCQIYSLTQDAELDTLEASNQYPIPEELLDTSFGQRLNWTPISYSEKTEALSA